MEKLSMKSSRSQAKVFGTLLCIGGSLIFTFWKGGHLFKGFVEKPLITAFSTQRHGKQNQIKGSALILTSHIAWCSWLVLQAMISKVYPAPLSLTTIICFRIVAIFLFCLVLCKKSSFMET
ncbi:WAT1-related protein At2g39510-like [Argentina anserina]|uniref:WAT1-related protein At2g39510-like n=1 Tax=Argentina anserina TaxID=57926 RepID=UPI002176321B|nr:WAT1-related protein At2g39510-like [Potentilla anserina]